MEWERRLRYLSLMYLARLYSAPQIFVKNCRCRVGYFVIVLPSPSYRYYVGA